MAKKVDIKVAEGALYRVRHALDAIGELRDRLDVYTRDLEISAECLEEAIQRAEET